MMTPEFISDPETYSNTLPIDVYAYGITLYHLITEIQPFSNIKSAFAVMSAVYKGERPEFPSDIQDNWKNMISSCWSQDPKNRPTFSQICNLLESDEFVTDKIDRDVFENYKKIVKPFRPPQKD